jgi:uncharacterized phage protein (TIGR01671 family)
MREIKFRGKEISTGNWAYGDLVHSTDVVEILFWKKLGAGMRMRYAVKVDPDTVGQFTGLIDDKKQEVYEGDFLTSDLIYLFRDSDIEKTPCLVEWHEKSGFVFRLGSQIIAPHDALDGWTSKVFRVVGNIFESLTPSPVTEGK